jgi:ribosome-binding factor A
MATSRRVARVSASIKREVSQMLLHDIKDDRVGAGMVSITDVDVAGDLQHAKIFVSIYGTDEAKAETMEGLKAAQGYVRRELGQRMKLRRTPEVTFKEDRSFDLATDVLNVLNQITAERKASELKASGGSEDDDSEDDLESDLGNGAGWDDSDFLDQAGADDADEDVGAGA